MAGSRSALSFEKGKTLPVGMSQRRYLGFDVVWLNCAFCHAGTVRETPQSEPKVYAAMPANTFDFRAFTRFLFATGEDRRFTPQDMLRQIDIIRQREGLADCRWSTAWCCVSTASITCASGC